MRGRVSAIIVDLSPSGRASNKQLWRRQLAATHISSGVSYASRKRLRSSGLNATATTPLTRRSLRTQCHFLRSGKEGIIHTQFSSSISCRDTVNSKLLRPF